MSRALPLLCLLAAATALADGDGIRLKARLDWTEKDAVTKRGRWHPVHVDVENLSGRDIEGKVWVEVEVGNGQVLDVRYQRSVTLPRDARKRFTLDVRLEGSESSVFVHADIGGFTGIRAIPMFWVDDDVDSILVVGKWPKGYLQRLEKRNPGPELEEYFPQRFTTLADPEDFPDSWRGLDGVETIVWDGVEMLDLSAAQAQAIEDWVAMGGSLVLAGGDAMESYYKSPLGGWLPGKYAERIEVDIAGELAKKVGLQSPTEPKNLLAARIAGVDAPSWATDGGVPMLVERREGLGRLCVVPFDLASEQTMGAKGVDLLLDYLAGHRAFSVARVVGPQDDSQLVSLGGQNWDTTGGRWRRIDPTRIGGGRGPLPSAVEGVSPSLPLDALLPESFRFASGVRVPPAMHIAIYLGLYILACLLNLVAWRAAHRREFAWATLLALSLGFAGYAWRDATLNAQAAPSAQHVTVIELGPDGHGGRQTSYFGFFTNVAMDVEVAASSPQEALSLLGWNRTQAIGSSEVEVTEDGRAPRIPELPLLPRSVSCVKTERAAPPEASVAMHTERNGSDILVTVTPPAWGSPVTPLLVYEDSAIPLDEKLPGRAYRGRIPRLPGPDRPLRIAELGKELERLGLASEMASAIILAVSQEARDGAPSWLVAPFLDAKARIRWAGRDVEVDRGVTVFIVPMRWDECADSGGSLTPYCRRTRCEQGGDTVVWELTPLCNHLPEARVLPPGWRSLDWRTGKWGDLSATSPLGRHPFTDAMRVRSVLRTTDMDRYGDVAGWWFPPNLTPR